MGRLVHAEHVWTTVVSLHLLGDGDLAAARDAAVAWLHRVDDVLSTFRPETDLARWRSGELPLSRCDPMVAEVLALSDEAAAATGGAFDPRWSGGAPDPTGLVKGWAAQRCLEVLHAHGVADAQVSAGGDVCTSGARPDGGPWRIGIAHPLDRSLLAGIVEGHDVRVATSGTDQRGAHILRRGEPVADLASASVAGPDLALADAFSTALFAARPAARTGLAAGLDAAGWPSLLVALDGALRATPGWPT